jgi:hypothetical protein
MHTQSSPGSPPHCSGILLCVTTILLIGSCGERASDQRQSVVQIRTSDGRILGSGFFVQLAKTRGEDAHVVVPYEFVSSGIPVVVESFVPAPNSGGGKYYIQEYPETAVVSAIPSANVAVLQVKNVPIEHIEPLVVSGATEVPPQSAVRMLGVLSNRNAKNRKVHDVDAEILNYETFAAWDPFIKRNLPTEIHGFAVDQPFDRGFIGGPILNELGEVIGQVAGEFAQESAGVKTIAVYASGIHRALDEAEVGEKADMPTIEDAQGVIDEALNALLMDVKANTEMIEGTLVRHAELPQLHQGLTELIQNSNVLENICGSGSERTKLQYQLSYLAATPPQVWETLPENGTECGDEQQCLRTIFRPYARSQFEAYLRWDRAEKAEYKVIPPLEDYGENTYRVRFARPYHRAEQAMHSLCTSRRIMASGS